MGIGEATNVTTGKARLSYVHLFKPYAAMQGQEEKFSVTVLIPKSDADTMARINAAIEAAKQKGIAEKWNGVCPPIVQTPVHDGDGVRPSDGMPFGDECKGHWVFTASAKADYPPEVVDKLGNPIINQSEVYSGMYGRVNVNFFPYAFGGKKGIGSSYYIRTERHDIVNGNLRIRNKAYKSTSPSTVGMQIPLAYVEEWANYPEDITYPGMTQMDFGYFRVPLKNKIDGSHCGVSVFEPAIERIKKADIQGARVDWEFESGERAIHVDSRALSNSESRGRRNRSLAKLNKRLYRGLNLQYGKEEELFKEFSPELREQGFINGLEKYYRQIEFDVGLAYGDLSDCQMVEKTATEIKATKYRKYNRVTAIQDKLKVCLEDFVAGVAFYNGLYTSGYKFNCNFSDSILTDEEAERKQDMADVAAGFMHHWEYRMKWYGEDEDTAKANVPAQNGVIE